MKPHITQLLATPEIVEDWCYRDWELLLQQAYGCYLLAKINALLKTKNLFVHVPPQIQWHFLSAYRLFTSHKKAVQTELREICKPLEATGITPIFLKGAAYVALDNEVSDGRLFSDVDILVPIEKLSATEQVLCWNGWKHADKDDYDQHYYRQWMHEIPPMYHQNRETNLDLHHNLLPPISGRSPNYSSFKTVETQISEELKIVTFSPSAMVLHSVVHLFFEEDFSKGFRDLYDLHQFFVAKENNEAFWDELLTLAKETGFGRELFYACRYSEEFFSTQMPLPFSLSLLNYSPTPIRLRLSDWMFKRILQPSHPLCVLKGTSLARFVALVRGHILKMPMHILLLHSGHKIWKGLSEAVLGKSKSKWQTEQ